MEGMRYQITKTIYFYYLRWIPWRWRKIELVSRNLGLESNSLEWGKFLPQYVPKWKKGPFGSRIRRRKNSGDNSSNTSYIIADSRYLVLKEMRGSPILTISPSLAIRMLINSCVTVMTPKTFVSNKALTSSIFWSVNGRAYTIENSPITKVLQTSQN